MIETLILAVTSFVGTNIDDIFIDTLLFADAKTKPGRWGIVLGKYLGVGVLVLVSILGAFGLQFLPRSYIGWLGLVPIALGIKEIVESLRSKEESGETGKRSSNMAINAALITIANGADNIGVYLSVFAGFALWQLAVTVGVFGLMVALWCFLAKTLADLPVLKKFLTKYKAVIVPVVYIALGVYILLENFVL